MRDIKKSIESLSWQSVCDDLNRRGFSIVPAFLSREACEYLKSIYDAEVGYRKTVTMEHYRFGKGEYKYWNYPLPDLIQTLREALYPKLAPLANKWMKALSIDIRFPDKYECLLEQCHSVGQIKPTPLILKYAQGGYNTLHQDLYGDVYFPLQAAYFLSEPHEDYTGGEFIMTEQVPRAQSRAIVLTPKRGDMIIFTTNYRPVKGTRRYFRAAMRHGVSEVHWGKRYTMGIIFHDAAA